MSSIELGSITWGCSAVSVYLSCFAQGRGRTAPTWAGRAGIASWSGTPPLEV
jgi:hypothetical protein